MNKISLIIILYCLFLVIGGIGYFMIRPTDCKVSEWGTWEACDSSGNRLRKRTIIEQPKNNGRACPSLIELDVSTCPIDCMVSDWGSWGMCDSTGTRTRTRRINRQPKNSGRGCPSLTEKDVSSCPLDCKVSDWGLWGVCTNGIKKRSRYIITAPKNNGTSCPILSEETKCPVDCKTTDWSPWTCSRQNYEKIRTRQMTAAAINGGQCILRDTSSCLFTINHPSTNKPWVDKPVNPANNIYKSSKIFGINHPNGITAKFAIAPFTDVSNGYMLVNTIGTTKMAIRHGTNTLWNVPLITTTKSTAGFVWKFEKQPNGTFIIRTDYKPDATKPAWVVGWSTPTDEIKIMPQDTNTIAWKIDSLYL